jgi:hypothetical protein
MSLKEHVIQALETLSEAELEKVAEYVAFLNFRARVRATSPRDAARFAALYAAFGMQDRDLAEAGMGDYTAGLLAEDAIRFSSISEAAPGCAEIP